MTDAVAHWVDLKTTDFPIADPARTIALLPVGAVEQHGPHLPLGTDSLILEAVIARMAQAHPPADARILIMPMQQVGDSLEHGDFPGTLTHDAETLIAAWTALCEKAVDAGAAKLAIVNSHGGQPQIVDIVAQRLRARRRVLAARINSYRFKAPDGLFAADELAFGYHGGEMETSLMLAIRPDLVAMEHAADFDTRARRMAQENARFHAEGAAGFAWAAQDLNPTGAMGNAAAADAARGEATLDHMARALSQALSEIAAFPLDALTDGPSP